MTSIVQSTPKRPCPGFIDLTKEYSIGSICFDKLDATKSLLNTEIDESINAGIRDFIFKKKNHCAYICRVVKFNVTTGEVEIRTSENPDKPTVRFFPDVIVAETETETETETVNEGQSLFHYDGCLVAYGHLRHKGIFFGDEVPSRMIGPVVIHASPPGIFSTGRNLVAVETNPGRYVLAALVDVDSNDMATPLVIRLSADYDIPCRKMALNSSVYRLK
jgi:hypothetical protein